MADITLSREFVEQLLAVLDTTSARGVYAALDHFYRSALAQQAEPAVPKILAPGSMVVGARYNWKHQTERLVYLGKNWSGNGYWHQFAKVGSKVVWCEVLDADLPMLEATPPTPQAEPAAINSNDNDAPVYSQNAVRRLLDGLEKSALSHNLEVRTTLLTGELVLVGIPTDKTCAAAPPTPPAEPSPAPEPHTAGRSSADDLRNAGLMVAVHNDYRITGEHFTFWLMVREDGMSFKGEGRTDADALDQIRAQVFGESASPAPDAATPVAVAREAFELWYADHWKKATRKAETIAELAAVLVTMREGDRYHDGDGGMVPYIDALWESWQAACAAPSTTPQEAPWPMEQQPDGSVTAVDPADMGQEAPEGLTADDIWRSDAIMAVNARLALQMPDLLALVRAVESAPLAKVKPS